MQKIMIIGSGGSGKSTLGQTLQERTGIEWIPLDRHYFGPGWAEPDKAAWAQKVEALSDRPRWILDGNYGGTMDIRLRKADTVIYLDFPAWLCILRVLRRTWRSYGKTRQDMAEGCPERFSWQFIAYLLHFRRTRRPGILRRLDNLPASTTVYILQSDHHIRQFLKKLAS